MASKVYSVVFTSAASNPSSATGLSPTFIVFKRLDNDGDLAGPAIAEVAATGLYKFSYEATLPIAFVLDGTASAPASTRYIAGSLDPIQSVDYQATTLTAIGTSNIALGTSNFALGVSNYAFGNSNFALGVSNFALGVSNFALGTTSVAIGTTLTGYGVSTYAIGTTLIGFGTSTYALGLSIITVLGSTASAIGSTSTDPSDIFGQLKRNQEFNEGLATFAKSSGIWNIQSRGGTLIAQRTLANTVTTVTKT